MDDGSATPPPAAGGSTREARRRKILDRGSDRLAFITGQASSVPPSPADPAPSADRKEPHTEPVQPKVDLPPTREEHLPKPELTDETTRKLTVTDNGVKPLPKCEISDVPKTHLDSERLVPSVNKSLSSQRADAVSLTRQEPKNKIFTTGRFSHCISSSENMRLVCAVAIAIFVVLSYQGSLFGSKMAASFINFRPICVVLLTDISLVLALLLTDKELPVRDDEANQMSPAEYDLGELIRLGFLVHKVTKAVFTDCCLCLVLVIIGIPFGKNL